MYQLKSDIPTPLQTRVLIQIALAIILLLAGIILLFLMTWLVTIPFLFLSLLLALDGCRICCAAVLYRVWPEKLYLHSRNRYSVRGVL